MDTRRPVVWKKGKKRPSAKLITKLVRGVVPAGTLIETDVDHIYVAASLDHWIELEIFPGRVDVVTRQASVDVDVLAGKIHQECLRRFRDKIEPEVGAVKHYRVAPKLGKTEIECSEDWYDDPDLD